MAKKITELPAASSVASTDVLPVVNLADDTARKATASQIVAAGFTAAGDITGDNTSQTVAKVKGTTIATAGGALPVGAVLRTTAADTADWGAVDLADPDAVTGTLPGSNVQAATTSNAGSMSAADKTKLDNMQPEGAAFPVLAMAIDWAASSVFTKTLAAGANTFTFSNATSGRMITVRVTGAASTLTWPTVKWPGGVAPTQTASGTDVYTFVHDGTNIYGSVVQAMA